MPLRRALAALRRRPDAEGRRLVAELAALTGQRRHDEAVALAAEVLPRYTGDAAVLKQVRASLHRAGEMTLHLEATEAWRRLADTPANRRREAVHRGRWRETEPGWLPAVPGEPEQLRPQSNGRVLHLLKASLPHRGTGYAMRSAYNLRAQLAAGLQPVAVTALGFPRSAGVEDFAPEDDVDGVRYLRLDPGAGYDPDAPWDRYLCDYAAAAAEVVRAERPAVIHAHSGHRGYEPALVGLALGAHFGLPVVYEVRGFLESTWTSDAEWAERSETYRRRCATEERCMAAADAVVTLSESMRAEIVSRGIDPAKVHIVPNGVDAQAFQPRTAPAAVRRRLGIGEEFAFGYVSNLDVRMEGQELLVQAAVELRRRGAAVRALIIGDGTRRAELEAYAAAAGAGDEVLFTGRVPHEEVPDYYAVLDAFVVPRLAERTARLVTPIKPYEAMAAGVPLVTSDLPALREVTGDGERGRYFTPGDASALADVLDALRADPAERERLAARARAWVLAERQWSSNGPRYARIYAALRS